MNRPVTAVLAGLAVAGTLVVMSGAGVSQSQQQPQRILGGGMVATAASAPLGTVIGNVTMGPQAMEGNLQVNPGASLLGGFDLAMTSTSHPAATVSLLNAQIAFQPLCGTKGSTKNWADGSPITVPIPDQSYADSAGTTAWLPSGSPYQQSSFVVPNNVCPPGQTISLKNGGTFSALVNSTDPTDKLQLRWHYSAGGSAGAWSNVATLPVGAGSFSITGSVSGLVPGTSKSLQLSVTNPNPWPIQLLEVDSSVATTPGSGCVASWLTVGNYTFAEGGRQVIVPAQSTVGVGTAPTLGVSLADTGVTLDENACRGSFTIALQGTATPVSAR